MILEEDLNQKPSKMCINLPKKVEKFRPIKLKHPSKKSSTDSLASATQFYQGLSCSLSHQVVSGVVEGVEMEDIAVIVD